MICIKTYYVVRDDVGGAEGLLQRGIPAQFQYKFLNIKNKITSKTESETQPGNVLVGKTGNNLLVHPGLFWTLIWNDKMQV